ncbi:MAG: ATP synthase F1 subunit delta [Symbiobacteriaceae bacterium]|nr:ATP synthase F1 subunit delta [Symbiobacteriaceae bacterium]
MDTLTTQYATALMDLAVRTGMQLSFFEQTIMVRDIIALSEVPDIMDNPSFPRDVKGRFVVEAFSGKIHEDFASFLLGMVMNDHGALIRTTLQAFSSLMGLSLEQTTALVVSATELDSRQSDILRNLIARKLNKRVAISVRVDPSLIAGFYIYVDGLLLDSSVAKHINDMGESIKLSIQGMVHA